MRVLVAGGAGYIGSVTTELLCDAGHDVTVFDNLERGHRAAVDPRAQFICGDLRYLDTIEAALHSIQPEAVLHFAAYIEVGESMVTPLPFFENNVVGSLNLVKAMVSAECNKLIFSSTCAIYGTPETIPMDESLPQRPESVYGESKRMCEKIFAWSQQVHGIECVFLRYFNASGATTRYGEDHRPESHLIPLILQVPLGKRQKIYRGIHFAGLEYYILCVDLLPLNNHLWLVQRSEYPQKFIFLATIMTRPTERPSAITFIFVTSHGPIFWRSNPASAEPSTSATAAATASKKSSPLRVKSPDIRSQTSFSRVARATAPVSFPIRPKPVRSSAGSRTMPTCIPLSKVPGLGTALIPTGMNRPLTIDLRSNGRICDSVSVGCPKQTAFLLFLSRYRIANPPSALSLRRLGVSSLFPYLYRYGKMKPHQNEPKTKGSPFSSAGFLHIKGGRSGSKDSSRAAAPVCLKGFAVRITSRVANLVEASARHLNEEPRPWGVADGHPIADAPGSNPPVI